MAIQVRAISDGFYKGARVRAGAVFTIADGVRLGKWMEPVAKPAAVPAGKKEAPAPVKKGKGDDSELA